MELVKLVVSAFDELASTAGKGFDAVLCLGNSLPHLVSDDALSVGLAEIRSCLRPGGILITQNLNYDKRWREKATFFPLSSGCVNGHEFILFKMATYYAEYLDFHIAVLSKGAGGWEYRVETTQQRPLLRDPLVALLAELGFAGIETYGSLKGVPFDAAESWDLVVVANAPAPL